MLHNTDTEPVVLASEVASHIRILDKMHSIIDTTGNELIEATNKLYFPLAPQFEWQNQTERRSPTEITAHSIEQAINDIRSLSKTMHRLCEQLHRVDTYPYYNIAKKIVSDKNLRTILYKGRD